MSAIMRPNGRAYRPRKVAAHAVTDERGDTGAKLRCDHIDRGKPLAEGMCREQVADGTYGDRTPGLPDGTYFWTAADVRRAARKLGWVTRVRSDGMRGGGFDFCPPGRRDAGRRRQGAHPPRRRAGVWFQAVAEVPAPPWP